MLLEILKIHVPPYTGVPRLSHQCPVEVVLTAVVIAVDVVEVGVITVVDVVVVTIPAVVVVVVMGVFVVVDDLHEDNTIEITMRKANSPQNVLLFI
jgi:hypothetical protein